MIPTTSAAMIAGLLNGIADYAASCYRDGYSQGIDHVTQLAKGEMSASDFEDTVAREKSLKTQKQRRFTTRKYKGFSRP